MDVHPIKMVLIGVDPHPYPVIIPHDIPPYEHCSTSRNVIPLNPTLGGKTMPFAPSPSHQHKYVLVL